MTTRMFVNLPAKDLGKSVKFFTALGFKVNQQITNETWPPPPEQFLPLTFNPVL